MNKPTLHGSCAARRLEDLSYSGNSTCQIVRMNHLKGVLLKGVLASHVLRLIPTQPAIGRTLITYGAISIQNQDAPGEALDQSPEVLFPASNLILQLLPLRDIMEIHDHTMHHWIIKEIRTYSLNIPP